MESWSLPRGKDRSGKLVADQIDIVGASDESYPLQKKGHTPEFLREIAHLRPRSNLFGSRLSGAEPARLCHSPVFSGTRFLLSSTRPSLPEAIAKAQANCFASRRSILKNPPKTTDGDIDYAKDFFARQTYLTVSGQLEAEAFACALSNVYTFGPTFRAENSNTSRHANEFWMIEPEMAFCDLQGNMDLAEEIVKYLIRDIARTLPGRIRALREVCRQGIDWRDSISSLERPFQRIPYGEAVELLKKSGEKFEFPVEYGANLQSEHERWLTEKHFKCR